MDKQEVKNIIEELINSGVTAPVEISKETRKRMPGLSPQEKDEIDYLIDFILSGRGCL